MANLRVKLISTLGKHRTQINGAALVHIPKMRVEKGIGPVATGGLEF